MGEEIKGKPVVCGICGIKIGEEHTEKVAYPTSKSPSNNLSISFFT
jgi:hypothetical protein